jgi:ABC-type histidine transport system ATPase subunit
MLNDMRTVAEEETMMVVVTHAGSFAKTACGDCPWEKLNSFEKAKRRRFACPSPTIIG